MGSESMAVKSKGYLKSITQLLNRKYQVVFEMEKPLEYKADELLTIEVKQYRKGRSLNANAYFHVLVDKMAKVNKITATAQKNMLLSDYGALDAETFLVMKDSIDYLELDYLHLRPTTQTKLGNDNELYRYYRVIKGSHEYDTKEMSQLIDGTVSECKELGIDTMTHDELEHMKGLWNG